MTLDHLIRSRPPQLVRNSEFTFWALTRKPPSLPATDTPPQPTLQCQDFPLRPFPEPAIISETAYLGPETTPILPANRAS